MPIASFRKYLTDLLYPLRCPLCQSPAPGAVLLCPDCAKQLPKIGPHACERCGAVIPAGARLCSHCQKTLHLYTAGRGAFRYEEPLRESLVALKYHGKAEYAGPLGICAYRAQAAFVASCGAAVLVPIPLHPNRLRKRGYNQAELLAEAVGRESGLPLRTDLLERRTDTLPSKELSREARFLNLRDAFFVPPGVDLPPNILLVDDIYTTGATIDAAAAALRGAGAVEIFFLTVCIGGGNDL